MPRKDTKATRAKTFLERWETQDTPIAPGVTGKGSSPMKEAAIRLFSPEQTCEVDAAIREALDEGFLSGETFEIRRDLTCTTIMSAAGMAASIYRDPKRQAAKARREEAANLATALRQFMSRTIEDADALKRLSERMEESIVTDDLRAICLHGDALASLLDELAEARPMPPAGNATYHEVREFFGGLEQWWEANSSTPNKRNAKAVRNRIAAALWTDVWKPGADGIDEMWAGKQFRRLRGKSKAPN